MKITATDSVLLYNGNILTLDDRDTVASGVVIEGGRISRVIVHPLDRPGASSAGSRKINLGGATVLPGFIDPHCHPLALGAALHAVDCSPSVAASITQIVERIAQAAAGSTTDWIRARGYDELRLAEKRHPTAADLDRAAPGRLVRLTHGSGHADVLNIAALNAVGIRRDTRPPPGGTIERDPETGDPTGALFEMGGWLRERMPPPGSGTLRNYAETASSALVAAGVTAVTDAGRDNTPARLALYAALAAEGRFLPRPTVMLSPGSDYPRVEDGPMEELPGVRAGAIKIEITFSSGEMHPDFDSLVDSMQSAHRAGRQIAVHVIELEAVAMACEAFAALAPGSEIARMRHRLEHASECPPDIARSIAAAGLSVVTQPGFIHERGGRYISAWRDGGPDPGDLYAVRTMLAAGLRVAGSSDAPFGPVAPLAGIQAAVTRLSSSGEPVGPGQSITVREALRIYGPDAAWMDFQETEAGSIEPGKRADFVVLDADPTAVEPTDIASIRVLATLIGGELVHGSLAELQDF